MEVKSFEVNYLMIQVVVKLWNANVESCCETAGVIYYVYLVTVLII